MVIYLPNMSSEAGAITSSRRDHLVDIGWRVGVGLGAGALVGYVVAGPLARVLMLLLRLTSPAAVRGVTSDDGFTIGVISLDSLFLLSVCGGLSAIAGTVYVCFRFAVPHRRLRLVVWTLLCGVTGGAGLVHADGVDFTLLEPTALAVGGFVALPALTGLLIALLVDRWSALAPARNKKTVGILAPGLLAPPAIPAAAAAGLLMLVAARIPGTTFKRAADLAATALAIAVIVVAGVDLARDIDALTSG